MSEVRSSGFRVQCSFLVRVLEDPDPRVRSLTGPEAVECPILKSYVAFALGYNSSNASTCKQLAFNQASLPCMLRGRHAPSMLPPTNASRFIPRSAYDRKFVMSLLRCRLCLARRLLCFHCPCRVSSAIRLALANMTLRCRNRIALGFLLRPCRWLGPLRILPYYHTLVSDRSAECSVYSHGPSSLN